MRRLSCCLPLLALAACTVGPNYKRPAIATPGGYRGASQPPSTASLADTKWPDLFQDEALRKLISTALEHNLDLAAASERVMEARARYRITGAEQYPFLYAAGQFSANRSSTIGSNITSVKGSKTDAAFFQVGAALSWEVDLWGQLRRLTEAARAQYLSSEEARRGVVVSLIADVTGDYFSLRERDLELTIAKQTRDIAARNLQLIQVRHDNGAATGLDVHQAEQLLYISSARIAAIESDIGQLENALSLLLGQTPGDIVRGQPLESFKSPPQLQAGLPSSLIERRPDIRQAEQTLIAANAQIGVARSYYFPQLSLTAFLGGQSRALSQLFTGPARDWSITPSALAPIFTAGQVKVAVRLSEAQQREMLVAYQKTIYNALREVSDALIRYDHTREERAQQDHLVEALDQTSRLATMRYEGGAESYLQVLIAERNLFDGQLAQAQLRLQELLSTVELYRALGGGWQ